MSITRSQASALADGFLDNEAGGSEKDEFQPTETYTELILLAGELVEDAQENLKMTNTNASGALSRSIILEAPVMDGSVLRQPISMLERGKYINSGVKGTKSGSGQYAFKYANPSRKMVASLLLGVRRAKKSTTNVNAKKTVSANEKKNSSISQLDSAWGAARNIKMYGIKATGFMDKAIYVAAGKVNDKLGGALAIDVLNSI